jgi:hypothetical protein
LPIGLAVAKHWPALAANNPLVEPIEDIHVRPSAQLGQAEGRDVLHGGLLR